MGQARAAGLGVLREDGHHALRRAPSSRASARSRPPTGPGSTRWGRPPEHASDAHAGTAPGPWPPGPHAPSATPGPARPAPGRRPATAARGPALRSVPTPRAWRAACRAVSPSPSAACRSACRSQASASPRAASTCCADFQAARSWMTVRVYSTAASSSNVRLLLIQRFDRIEAAPGEMIRSLRSGLRGPSEPCQ